MKTILSILAILLLVDKTLFAFELTNDTFSMVVLGIVFDTQTALPGIDADGNAMYDADGNRMWFVK